MKQHISYYKKCLCCGFVHGYILRAENVNTNITDKDVHTMIANSIGDIQSGWCTTCNMQTAKQVVGYDLEESNTIPKEVLRYEE